MQVVQRPGLPPGECIATLKSEDPLGFIDTEITRPDIDPRVYVSLSFVKFAAGEFLGMVDGSTVEALEAQVKDLQEQLAEYDRELDAIHVLRARGYTPAKKPGRPKAQAA